MKLSEYIFVADWYLLIFCVDELIQISKLMHYFVSKFVRQNEKSVLLFLIWHKDKSEDIPWFRETSVASWKT